MSNSLNQGRERGSLTRRRWVVHIALVAGFAAAAGSAIFLSKSYLGHSGVTDHAIIGTAVFGLIVIHLIQRRRTLRRFLGQLLGKTPSSRSGERRAASDLILWLLTLNTMASGTADFIVGHTIFLPIPGPNIVQKWHAFSALVLLIYVVVHVLRRRTHFWSSHIR